MKTQNIDSPQLQH